MKTHYDVLNLDKNCTEKEIKDSFLNLSKKYHPDKNKNSDAHKKFVEVNEAYSVLGKPTSRHMYDESLSFERQTIQYTARPTPKTYEDYAYYYAKNIKRQQENGGPYFTKRKMIAILLCFGLMAVGSAFQVRAEVKRRYARSQQVAAMYKEHKEHLQHLSKEEKLKEFEKVFLRNSLKRENIRKQQ